MKKKKFLKSKRLALAVMPVLAAGVVCCDMAFAEEGVHNETEVQEEVSSYFFDDVVVTATRTPVEIFKANANISVITSEDIANHHYEDLSEALRSVPGVTILNHGGPGYENAEGIRINGAKEVVILVDGVKMNMAGQAFSARMFKNLDNIERIEVLKGSASTLYGADAKGGVINIITKKIDYEKTKMQVAGGSFSTENYLLSHEGRDKDLSWRISQQKNLSGDFKDGNGVSVPAYLNADTTSVKITKEFGEKSDLTFTYDGYKADTKSKALWEQYLHDGKMDNYNWKIIYNTQLDDKSSNQFSYMNSVYDTNLEYESYGMLLDNLMKIKTKRVSDQYTRQLDENNTFVAGFEYTQDQYNSNDGYDAIDEKKLTNRSFYMQDQWAMDDKWLLTGGVRHDNHSEYGGHTTPSVNLGYTADDATNVYIGYSEYFVAPTPYYLYSPYGNSGLKPETGDTLELGINHRIDETLTASAHLFKRDSKDYIDWNSFTSTYSNLDGETKTKGWDVQLNKQFADNFSGFVGYTHTSVDKEDVAYGYIPKGAWNVGLDYKTGKLGASLLGRGVIDRQIPSTSAAPTLPAETYWVWDLGLNYQATDEIKGFIKINNLFDKYYAEHTNVNQWGASPGDWWSAPGRSVMVGMEYTF